MSVNQEFRFPSADGATTLYGRIWVPDHGAPKAVLQLVHGIAEHIGRYDRFARFMSDHGYLVCAEDHLGHGNTPENAEDLGYTADKDGWVKMTDNVRALHERITPQYPGIPYFILGHSMGSFLTRSYLIRYPGTVDACALLGTGQQPESVLKAGLAACRLEQIRLGRRGRSKLLQSLCFGAYNSQFKPNRTESDWVCSVDEVVDAYIADPFCQVMPTVTLMRDMLTGIRFNQQAENLAKMDKTTPVFFLSGDQDPVGSNGKGVRAAYQSFLDAGCSHVRLKLYPGGRHEMLNEHNWQDVYDELLSWFDQQIK
ncbi:MAG: alpha/beta hydrolase [Oscillospiraceae bacterium]|nr:lysophospholipase [Eubacteriales bacterium]MDY2617524.1 alpha/beta hydrolase [Oscillospiraceae bacterium]